MTILLCKEPGSREKAWDCGESQFGQPINGMQKGRACLNEETDEGAALLTYTYTADQVEDVGLILPPHVGIHVAGTTGYKWIVLFTHYPDKSNLTDGWSKNSSMSVTFSEDVPLMESRSLTLITYGNILPHTISPVVGSLVWEEEMAMHPFAYFVHSHEHALRDWVYSKDHDTGGISRLIDQTPADQRYKNLTGITIRPGDSIFFGCLFNNTGDQVLEIK